MAYRIDLFDDVGGWGVTANAFLSWLKKAGSEPIELHINSYGGDVFDGIAIMNALRDYAGHVTAVVEGIAASAASFIAVGGADEVIMQESATLMIHDAWTELAGNALEIRKRADELERMSDIIAQVYADKSGTPATKWREAMAEEAYFSADEAVLVGLADTVRRGARAATSAHVHTRMFNAARFVSREQAPEPSLVREIRGREEGKKLSFLSSLAQELGLEAKEDELKASLQAFFSKTNSLLESEEAPTEEAPTEEAPIEEAPTEEASTEELEESEPLADSDAVLVPRAVYDDLLAAQEKAGELVAAERERALVDEVDTWISQGRFSASRRAEAITAITKNAEMARAVWGKLPQGSINRKEAGYGGEQEPSTQAAMSPFTPAKF